MRTTICRWGRGLGLALLALQLAACTAGREPAYDAAIADAVTRLATDTARLLHDLETPDPEGFAERAGRFSDLIASARTIRLMAEARGAGTLAGPSLIGQLFARQASAAELTARLSPELAGRLDEYADATEAYMADYLRNLEALAMLDRSAHAGRAERVAAHVRAAEAHGLAMRAYLAAWEAWQRGEGAKPAMPEDPPPPPMASISTTKLALRRAALEDILRDVLVYERTILDRTR